MSLYMKDFIECRRNRGLQNVPVLHFRNFLWIRDGREGPANMNSTLRFSVLGPHPIPVWVFVCACVQIASLLETLEICKKMSEMWKFPVTRSTPKTSKTEVFIFENQEPRMNLPHSFPISCVSVADRGLLEGVTTSVISHISNKTTWARLDWGWGSLSKELKGRAICLT